MCQPQGIGIFEWTRARRTETSSFYNHVDPFKGNATENEWSNKLFNCNIVVYEQKLLIYY